MKMMQRIKSVILVVFVLSLSLSILQTSVHVSAQTAAYANPQVLVDAKWVNDNKDKSGVVVVDARSPADYAKGHIPGAINFDPAKALRDVDSRIQPVSTVAKKLGDVGINELSTVVLHGYDSSSAHRAYSTVGFWILQYVGNNNVRMFPDGLAGWTKAGYPTTTNPTKLSATTFKASVNQDVYASTQWVQDHLNDSSVVIIDTRTPAEYVGDDIRSLRGGHIPGAINIDVWSNFDSQGNLLSPDKLAALYANVDKTKTIVTYCHTAGRGSISYWTLVLLGYQKVRLYDDSWVVWGNDVRLPVESESWFDINAVNGMKKDVITLKDTVAQLNATVNQLKATASKPSAAETTSPLVVYGSYLVGIIGIVLAVWGRMRRKEKT